MDGLDIIWKIICIILVPPGVALIPYMLGYPNLANCMGVIIMSILLLSVLIGVLNLD